MSDFHTSNEDTLRSALRILLDHIDYERGACRPNEMIGAVLPVEVLRRCKSAANQEPTP
jgi:hypothetical protein